MARLNAAFTWLAHRPGLAVTSGMLLAGLLLAAATPFVGAAAADAAAPLMGTALFVALASRYKPSPPAPRGGTHIKVIAILVLCALVVVLILVVVPSGGR